MGQAISEVTTTGPYLLAIESSCDETAAAVIRGPARILSNVVASQIAVHAAFGGVVGHAKSIMHGKTSMVHHKDSPLMCGMKDPFPAGRYHSLALVREKLPDCLVVDAWTNDDEIMGVHHTEHQTYGVQFHPESVLTPGGKRLLRNFMQMADA